MKHTRLLALLAAALCLSMAASGCRKKPQGVVPLPKPSAPPVTGAETPTGPVLPPTVPIDTSQRTTATTTVPETGIPPAAGDFSRYREDRERFKAETVYFDFDKSNIRPDQRHKLDAIFAVMQTLPGKALKIEGHCDERGTEQYNQALGERRALAAREYLVMKGMNPAMITTISYGEERPADPGHNEAAWAKNRRCEFILLIPPGE